ncbi:hypothetical protein GCM10022254_43640 [Actinomadura meridiana]|uniref:Uncharacterized protein n=1 Tax=Actinomadura meridiana TaxID=559626 RepID=A0ABP8C8R5_9ACTN
MASEKLPREACVATIQEAHEMAALLGRSDLSTSSAAWWYVVISVCNTGLLGAELGAADADEWGKVLVCALDKARDLGVLGEEETVHRRMIACAASLRYFGVCEGEENRDPNLIVGHFLATQQGDSPQDVLRKCVDILRVPREIRVDASFREGIKYVTSVRMALQALGDVVEYLHPGPLREAAVRWCDIAILIPRSRVY